MQNELFEPSEPERLSASFPSKMVLLDCETTGSKAQQHRIIEIGLLLVDDGVVTERWQSFIDPERPLPPFITQLTGITEPMLRGQPRFADIAETLLDKLKDRIFVAHNARFDYGFIKTELGRLGITYNAKTLCSVKFSRALYPQFKRHGIDQLIKRFEFSINNRHRALDDAEVIWKLFLRSTQLYSDDEIQSAIVPLLKSPSLPPKIKQAQIKALPQAAGVYYFYSEEGTLLYVGKSVNIRTRVMSHFSQDIHSNKEMLMNSKVAHIDYKRTPGDLGAQLLESSEIKRLSPLYNRRLRRTRKLFSYELEDGPYGYKLVHVRQVDSDQMPDESAGLFRSPKQATKRLEKLADDYFLCYKLLGLEGHAEDQSPCFRRQLKRCFGACEGAEPPEDYNARFNIAMNKHQLILWPFHSAILVEEQDPNDAEFKHFHLIDQWLYLGRIENEQELQERGYYIAPVQGGDKRDPGVTKPTNLGANDSTPEQAIDNDTPGFDLDVYHILLRFLLKPEQRSLNSLRIHPLKKLGQTEATDP